ncbi:hypothetical protein TNCV_3814001 [Trichonephila clavipes]|nr:hypothetical protein TNCV_3814001 [Trichonephila clavipes]
MAGHQKSSPKLNSLGVKLFVVPIGLPWGHDILVLKTYTMGIKEMTGWVSTSGTVGSNLKSETQAGAKIL